MTYNFDPTRWYDNKQYYIRSHSKNRKMER